MKIELNKVGVDIDGKVYQFYKLNFGFQRKLVELQSTLDKLRNEIAKRHDIDIAEVTSSDKVSKEDKLTVAKASMDIHSAMAGLVVNQDEVGVIDLLDSESLQQLIQALR